MLLGRCCCLQRLEMLADANTRWDLRTLLLLVVILTVYNPCSVLDNVLPVAATIKLSQRYRISWNQDGKYYEVTPVY